MPSLPLRRNFPRYPVQKLASYDYRGKKFLTLTLDLGPGGIKIKTHQPLPEDELVNLKLILENDSIWVKGRIAYSMLLPNKQSVSGIQFMELSLQDHTSLHKCLATLEQWPRPRGMLSAGERGQGTADVLATDIAQERGISGKPSRLIKGSSTKGGD